jgi:very-short-patch-repair endonuclease
MAVTGTRLYDPPRNGEGDHAKQGGGGPRILEARIKQVKRARQLRGEMSLPEVLLWQVLRKRPERLKFRKQFPIGEMTVDFACLERRLIIEVDGEGHSSGDQPKRDAARDALLRREGFRVMRIAARDVLKNMDGVLRHVVATCSEAGPLHHSAAQNRPPPRSGEELL